uniref:Uncharacterized protein n=1 Tax=Arcella intermedia TaxID=1963864 RepID=A0A6B2LJQ8_9EUKA
MAFPCKDFFFCSPTKANLSSGKLREISKAIVLDEFLIVLLGKLLLPLVRLGCGWPIVLVAPDEPVVIPKDVPVRPGIWFVVFYVRTDERLVNLFR